MVNAKVIGVALLLALGITQSYAEEDVVLHDPTDLVKGVGNLDHAPAPANDDEPNLGKETALQLDQDPSLDLEENIEAPDNLSVTFTDQNTAQSIIPSSISSKQNEGSGNPFILPYVRQSGTAADLLHLIQRSRSLPSPSEISGTFYTLNILPPDLDKSYEPEGVQVNPNQRQEPSHQAPPESSRYSLSQGSETLYESGGQEVKNDENIEHPNVTIQQKEMPPFSSADSKVLEQHEEVSQDLPDLDEQKSLANRKRELDVSATSSQDASLNDQELGVLEETQIKAQEDNTPQKIENSQDPTSEVPTILASQEPVDYIADVYLTSDWPKALEITPPVEISLMNDSIQRPLDSTIESDALQNSGDTSPPSIPTQDKLGTDIITNVTEKLVHKSEDPQAAHPPETQGKLASFEHPQPQPKLLVATAHEDSQFAIQNHSSLFEIPINSDTTMNIGEKLSGILFDNHNNESQKSAVLNINKKELGDTKLATLDLSHLSSEGHSLFVEVLPLDTELQRAVGISSAAEELPSQISADTEPYYNIHSIQLPENTVSSSIQRDQMIQIATEIPVELKSVSPVNTGSPLHSLTESSNEVQPVTPQQREHLPHSPAIKEMEEAILIPPSPIIRQETHVQDHSIDEGQQPTLVPESYQEPNSDSNNDKFHHRDLSIEGSALSGPNKVEISTISTPRQPQEVTAPRQPRRSRGGLTPLFTPPETREDFKESLPHSPVEEAKASTPYQFSYNVKDPSKGADFGHQEGSDGKTVKGQYFVVLPDGRRQTVQYQADHENGYQSEVEYHPQDVSTGGIIRGDAFSLEHIFTRDNNNNLQDLGSNNNANNQYQQEVLQNNNILNQGIGTDYQHIPNEEVRHQPHQDGDTVHINDPSLHLTEQPFQVSNDQYQIPVDNQFQQLSPGSQQGLISDQSHFKQSDFDDQFPQQDNFDQPSPHSETTQYQSLNGGPDFQSHFEQSNFDDQFHQQDSFDPPSPHSETTQYQSLNSGPDFQPDFGGGQFSLHNNEDQFHPVEADQFKDNNQFLQHGEIRNEGNIQPSGHFSHHPIEDGDQHFVDGDNQYQLVSNGDQLFPIAEGNQHQFQDNGNQDQHSVVSQYQDTNVNNQFVLQNEGNPFHFQDGSDHLQINGDFGQFPHSSKNNPVQYTHSDPLNAQSGNVPFIARADDSEFQPLIHGNQSQPPPLNEESFGSQSRSDPVESQIIDIPLPSRTLDLQTQPFLSPSVIPTTEDLDLNPSYNINEYESSIETSYDQTQNREELKSITSQNFPQRRDVHNQKKATNQDVPSIDHQSNISCNDSQDGHNDFHNYDGRESAQELIETESGHHFENENSHSDDFSSESLQAEEVLHENVERNSFESEGLVHDIPETLEEEKLYSESSDS